MTPIFYVVGVLFYLGAAVALLVLARDTLRTLRAARARRRR